MERLWKCWISRKYIEMGILICLKITIASSSINVGFFDYGTINENEIIPVSNQATELPAICPYGRPKASLLPKIFCLRKHVSSFADCFTGMVSFFVVYWLLPYSCGETECGKEEGFFIDHIPVFPTYIDAIL